MTPTICHQRIGKCRVRHRQIAPRRIHLELLLCRNVDVSPEPVTNVGGKRSSVMENNHVLIVLSTVMVWDHNQQLHTSCELYLSCFVWSNSLADCTYDQPSNRRRNPAPQYIEALETRLQRAETVLRTVLPNVDLNDPNIDAIIQQMRQAGHAKDSPQTSFTGEKPGEPIEVSEKDAQLRSMIASTGQLDLDDSGHWDFHGGSSGTVFVRRMREQFGGLLGLGDKTAPFLPRLPRPAAIPPMFDSPRSSAESPLEAGLPNTMDLPSRETAKALCSDSLNCACALLRFVHQPTFYEMFDRIYDTPPENFGDDENRFLPLLYVVLSLGSMFHTEPTDNASEPVQTTYKAGIDQGYV